eukprot:sb/3471230/
MVLVCIVTRTCILQKVTVRLHIGTCLTTTVLYNFLGMFKKIRTFCFVVWTQEFFSTVQAILLPLHELAQILVPKPPYNSARFAGFVFACYAREFSFFPCPGYLCFAKRHSRVRIRKTFQVTLLPGEMCGAQCGCVARNLVLLKHKDLFYTVCPIYKASGFYVPLAGTANIAMVPFLISFTGQGNSALC